MQLQSSIIVYTIRGYTHVNSRRRHVEHQNLMHMSQEDASSLQIHFVDHMIPIPTQEPSFSQVRWLLIIGAVHAVFSVTIRRRVVLERINA